MDHNSRETLSDHIPIVYTFVFLEETEAEIKKGSYLKMDHKMLADPKFLGKIQLAWESRMRDGVDPRVCWELGWKAIRRLMKEKNRRLIIALSKEQLEHEL